MSAMKRNKVLFILLCLLAAIPLWAERYVEPNACFSIDLPEGWSVAKQGEMYIFSSENDVMTMSIMQAGRGESFSPNDAYTNLRKGEEGMQNVKAHRGMWLTFYRHYVTRTYEQNGQQISEYYRIFPKKAFFFRTLNNENNEAKLAIARSARIEPWNFWTQFVITGFKAGWLLTLIGIFLWIGVSVLGGWFISQIKDGPIFVIGVTLLWLAIPLLWIDGEQIMITLYVIAAISAIAIIIYEIRKPKEEPKSELEREYAHVSLNEDLLQPLAAFTTEPALNIYAANNLLQKAYDYQEGRNGVRKNEKTAFEYMLQAAQAGNVIAMVSVSLMYRDGDGVKRDRTQASEWAYKAAKAGSCRAIGYLSSFTYFGYGIFKTCHEDSIWLLQKAKQMGDEPSAKVLDATTETITRPTFHSALQLKMMRGVLEKQNQKPEMIELLLEKKAKELPQETIVRFKKMDNLYRYFMTEKERKKDERVSKALDLVTDKLDDVIGYFT